MFWNLKTPLNGHLAAAAHLRHQGQLWGGHEGVPGHAQRVNWWDSHKHSCCTGWHITMQKTSCLLSSGTSGSWWATTVATFCPSSMAKHPRSKSRGCYQTELSPCISVTSFKLAVGSTNNGGWNTVQVLSLPYISIAIYLFLSSDVVVRKWIIYILRTMNGSHSIPPSRIKCLSRPSQKRIIGIAICVQRDTNIYQRGFANLF